MNCKICKTETNYLEKHHIIPRSRGGTNDPENLIEICIDCHSKAHDVSFRKNRDSLQLAGVKKAKELGKYKGRPKGATNKANENLLKKYPKVVKELKAGLSLRKVVTLTGVSINTVRKVKAEM